MRLYLTHVDTPYRMYRENLDFSDRRLMLCASDADVFDPLFAVCAFWCDRRLEDEAAWQENRRMRVDAKCKLHHSCITCLFSVEDARLLGEKPLTRLNELYDDGVRLLTPMWQGVNRLGGAHDTNVGLTTYGKRVICAAMEMGMLIDLSHASDESAEDIFALASHYHMPVCATHSNFRGITPHTRNLSDTHARKIAESGGFIGLCLVPSHVGGTRDLTALIHMYEHGCSLGLGDCMALGSDFDGTDELITPLTCAADLSLLADAMAQTGYTPSDIEKLFYLNAAEFFSRRFPLFFS